MVLILVALAASNLRASDGAPGDDSLGVTAGETSTSVVYGTEPFEMAGPSDGGSTTLPEAFFDDDATTTQPATTTTLAPLSAPNSDPLCQGALVLGDMFRRVLQIPDDVEELRTYAVEQLRVAAQLFENAGEVYRPAAEMLRQRADLVEAAADTTEMAIVARPLIELTDPALVAILPDLKEHVGRVCPSLALA